MLKDLSKELKARLYDRVTDPFFVSLIVAFSLKNWRIFLHLFNSQESTAEKIKGIELIISEPLNFLIPAAFAAFYTFIYPWLKYFITWYSEWVLVKIKNKKTQVQSQELLSLDEGLKMKAEYDKQIETFLTEYQTAKEDYRILLATVSDVFYTKKAVNDTIQFQILKYVTSDILYKWVFDNKGVATEAVAPNDPCIGIVMEIMSPVFCVVQTHGYFRQTKELSQLRIPISEKKDFFLSETRPGMMTSDASSLLSRDIHKVGRIQPLQDGEAVFYIEQQRGPKKTFS